MGSPLRTATMVFLLVCAGSGIGLLLGFAFGHWAGAAAPTFFENLLAMPGQPIKIEPKGAAQLLGAFGGLMLGGGLSVFAITVALAARALAVFARTRQ